MVTEDQGGRRAIVIGALRDNWDPIVVGNNISIVKFE